MVFGEVKGKFQLELGDFTESLRLMTNSFWLEFHSSLSANVLYHYDIPYPGPGNGFTLLTTYTPYELTLSSPSL